MVESLGKIIVSAALTGIFLLLANSVSPVLSNILHDEIIPRQNEIPALVDFYSDLGSPQPHDNDIVWFASARDIDNDDLYYKFQLRGPNTDGKWETEQDWSGDNSWRWDPNRRDIGENRVRVLVKDNKHVLSAIGDDNETSDIYIIAKSLQNWMDEASAFAEKGEFENALNAVANAIELDPENSEAIICKGQSLLSLGRFREAVDVFDTAIEIDPENSKAVSLKEKALSALENRDESVHSNNSLPKSGPGSPIVLSKPDLG